MNESLAASVAVLLLTLLAGQQWYLRSRLKEQRRIETDLRTSERKFSGILSIAADAIITVDSALKIVHFNRGAEEIFRWSSEDAIGRHMAVLLPPRFRQSHDLNMDGFARSTATSRRMGERREIFGMRFDGTEFPAEASISKLVEADGILFTVVLRDITIQKNKEANERFLTTTSAEFAKTLDVEGTLTEIVDLPVPILGDCCILDLTTSQTEFRRILGTSHDPELQHALTHLAAVPLTHDSPSPVIDVLRRNRPTVVNLVNEDWLDGNADPAAVPAYRELGEHAQLILPLHVAGETIGALTIIRTGQRKFDQDSQELAEQFIRSAAATLANAKLYETARQANRARDEVLGVVSHDLRNPINAIAMCAKALASEETVGGESRREIIRTIEDSAAWMNRLIGDLLDVANIDRDRLALERRLEDPARLVTQALQMFAIEAEGLGITLSADVPGEIPPIHVDGARIVQVLSNLLRNALNFTPRGGLVAAAAEARIDHVLFAVRDTGPGVAAENRTRIFERYWQSAHSARTRGSGLGLSIARGIVEAHGGRIWVEDVSPHGSELCFTIPMSVLGYRGEVR